MKQIAFWQADSFSGSLESALFNRPRVSLPCSQQPCPERDQFMPRSLFLNIYLFYCCPVIYSCVFRVASLLHVFSTRTLYACFCAPYVPLSVSFIRATKFGTDWKIWSPSLLNFLHSPVISSLLEPNIFPSTEFWTPPAYALPLNWERNFHTHTKQKSNYISVHLSIYIFDIQREGRRFWTGWQGTLPEFNLLFMSSWGNFDFVSGVHKNENFDTFSLVIFVSLHTLVQNNQ